MKYKELLEYQIHPTVVFGRNVRVGKGVVIEEGCMIGDNTLIGNNTTLRKNTIIGKNCTLGHSVVSEGNLTIGNHVGIHSQCHLTQTLFIEDHVFMGPSVVTSNTRRISHGRNLLVRTQGPRICRAARIGAGAVLTPEVIIGENALIGAGSLVTKDIPAREIWYGNPAKYIDIVLQSELL